MALQEVLDPPFFSSQNDSQVLDKNQVFDTYFLFSYFFTFLPSYRVCQVLVFEKKRQVLIKYSHFFFVLGQVPDVF